jgi:HSP20 family protein
MATNEITKAGLSFPAAFEDFFKPLDEWFDNGNFWGKVMKVPAVNVTDNKDNYLVSMAAPGLKKEDFRIDVYGNMLSISSKKEESKEETEEKFTRKEYNYSSFSRSFSIPDEVNKEKIDATYKDGILMLTLPKIEEVKKDAGAKQIMIK